MPNKSDHPKTLPSASMNFDSLRIFSLVVDLGSFSRVARQLGCTPATIGKHIAALEERLRTQLVSRTTRRLFITEAGQRLYEHATRVFDELEQAEAELSETQREPSGHIRVTAPGVFATRILSPHLPGFMGRYPKLSLELILDSHLLDLYAERIDVAIRITSEVDPGLIAIKLAPNRRVICAAPEYLRRHGTPRSPAELAQHNCLLMRGTSVTKHWPMRSDDVLTNMPVGGNFVADNGELLRDAVLAGLGIVRLPFWLVDADLRAGRLTEILADHVAQTTSIFAVLPQRTYVASKVRCFVDFLKATLSPT